MSAHLWDIFQRNRLLFIIIFVLCISSLVAYFSGQVFISSNTLGSGSYHIHKPNSSIFSLYTTKGTLYHSNQQHLQAALDFIQQDPRDYLGTKLFTNNLDQNIHLTRLVMDPVTKQNGSVDTEHYFFQQIVDGIPVYGSQIAVHLKKSSDVYAAAGAVITNYQPSLSPEVTQDQAKIIALQKANEDAPSSIDVQVQRIDLYMLNLQAIGFGTDAQTRKTLAVTITSRGQPVTFAQQYFVDLASGNVVYSQSISQQLLSRSIYNCSDTANCVSAREEGQSVNTDQDVNNLYTIFSKVYGYYHQHFGRDSLDNNGMPLVGYVHRSNIAGFSCPNAAYLMDGEIQLCDGMVVTDIVAHELSHAVTHYTAGLIYAQQAGAINESNSDIFASAIDGNWSIGEDIHLPGVLTPFRYLNDPPLRNQPDRLFSALYYCGHDDNGGIHVNEGVINKSFYLMTQGGSFNGCQVSGIGKERGYAMEYRALTRYLTPTANFKDMYIAWLLSCNDLYGANPSVCLNVEHALQATELDQQSDADQIGPRCENRQAQKPLCSTNNSDNTIIPSVTPEPNSSSSGAQTVLPIGKNSGCQLVSSCQGGANGIQMCTFRCK